MLGSKVNTNSTTCIGEDELSTTLLLLPRPPPRVRVRVAVERIGRHLAGEHHRPRIGIVRRRREPVLRRDVDLGLEEGRERELALRGLDEERRRACARVVVSSLL